MTKTQSDKSVCQIPRWRSCCCTCRYHVRDYHHCTTSKELRERFGGCVCTIPKGWVCLAPETDGRGVYSGWTEHGMCEMWTEQAKGER